MKTQAAGKVAASQPNHSKREIMKGDRAIIRLGKNLPAIAKRFRIKDSKMLERALREDPHLFLNIKPLAKSTDTANADDVSDAQLYFADQMTVANATTSVPKFTPVSGIPDSQTFLLHSRPGATAILWLNYQGSYFAGGPWTSNQPYTADPYTIDTDPNFSAAELARIKAMWSQVSEDYSPFNIDVTTEKPANNDVNHFIEIVITNSPSFFPNLGGICNLNNFTSSTAKQCFVWSVNYGDDPKSIAEASTHEAGHSLGLMHWSEYDSAGTLLNAYFGGLGTWAPIMGFANRMPMGTWSDGNYPGGSTLKGFGIFQDDMAVINASVGSLITDEAGSTPTSAAPLSATGSTQMTVNQVGVISSQSDVDVFKFRVSGGSLNLTVSPDPYQPNLDFSVRILDSAFLPVFSQNPPKISAISATLNGLPVGDYYIEIAPVGWGDASKDGYPVYCSNGRYWITGTYSGAASTPTPTATPKPATPTPATPTPTATPIPATPTPTATPKPATPTPTATPIPATPTPTATPKPATPTPTPGTTSCVRDRWMSTQCGNQHFKILKVWIQ